MLAAKLAAAGDPTAQKHLKPVLAMGINSLPVDADFALQSVRDLRRTFATLHRA
jgi:hypothetical protein